MVEKRRLAKLPRLLAKPSEKASQPPSGSSPEGKGARADQAKPQQAPTSGVLPMALHVGDRFTNQTGEWEIVSRPHTTVGGKMVHVRVRKVGEPTVTEERSWSAYERVAVKRA